MNMISDRRNRARGFTLLELLLVLTITGLALALTPPLFSGLVPTLTLRGDVRDIAQLFSEMRSHAITTEKETAVYFYPVQRRYSTKPVDGGVVLSSSTEISAKGEVFSSDMGEGVRINFYPDGSSSGGSVRLANENNAYRVDVNWLTGLPAVSEDSRG